METNRPRALIYLRVSTDRQAQKGIALPTQEEHCLAHAASQGYFVDPKTDIYVDGGESARSMDRPALMDLLSRCKEARDVRAVIVYDVSRLARNRLDFALIKQTLKKNGVVFLSATEPINETVEGQMFEGILSTMAEFFSAQNARKVRANMIRKAESGGWPNIAPYGYRNRKEKFPDGSIRAWIEPNPEEARWVRRAFELYAKGLYPVKTLASVLNKEGFSSRVARNRTDRFLHHSHLDKMLRNKIYIGVIEWGGVVNENGTHEHLIDHDLFYRVQDLLRGRSSSVTRQRRHRSLFKRIAFCAECGSAMTIDLKETSATKAIRYLRCRKIQKGKPVFCTQRYFAEECYTLGLQKLLERVELSEESLLDIRKKIEALTSEDKLGYEQKKKKIEAELQSVHTRQENLLIRSLEDDPRDETKRSLYERVKTTLIEEERKLSRELSYLAQRLGRIGRIIMIALDIAGSCGRAFMADADPSYRGLIGEVIFKEVRLKEGMIVGATLNTAIALFRKWAGEKPLEILSDLALLCAPEESLVDGGIIEPQRQVSLSEIKDDLLRLQDLITPEEEAEIESCYHELCRRGIIPPP